MKKRLISILLTVLMVMSLFSGMSFSAYADDDTIGSDYYVEYTLAEGDYVLRICQKLGINYWTCKDAIMALNNITSENGFRYLSIGETVKIPVSDAAAIAIMKGSADSSSTGTGAGTPSGNLASSDTIAYYLIPYVMQRGETVLGVCNAMGLSFADYADQIMKLNNISSWSKVKAGDTVLLPSKSTPAVGTTCFAVVAHKIASGETAYSICQKAGVNYGSSTKLLQALNNSDNLANLKAGKNFYLPVVTTIKAAGTTTGGTTTGGTTTGGTTTGGTTTGGTTTGTNTAASYNIAANINTNYGSMAFYVNNQSVNKAAAGATVTVDVTTKDGRAIESLVVKYADGRADVKLEGNSFVMPACDVRVDANIKSGYDITINSNYSYKTAATVGGVSVSSAAKGSSVKIVSTDPSFAVDTIKVYYSTLLGIKKTVTVNDANCFVMPAKDVTVDVTLAPVKTYNFYREDCFNGGFDLRVDGNSVSKAAKGAKVTVVWEAASGYDIGFISVTNRSTGKSINVFNNSFTMPASDVTVEVGFINNINPIEIEAVAGGLFRAYDVNDNRITDAETGETVYIKAEAIEDGYTGDYDITVIRKADGHYVSVAADKSFRMPAGGVTVTGSIKGAETNKVTVTFNGTGSENSVTLKAGANEWTVKDIHSGASASFAVGSTIKLDTLARDSHAFTKFNVYIDGKFDQEATDLANEQGVIYMPNAAVALECIFTAGNISIGNAKITGNGTVSYQVLDNATGTFQAANSCKVGDTVKIIAAYATSGMYASADSIQVINNETGRALQLTKELTFEMPAEGVTISVNFVGEEHTLKIVVVNENGSKDMSADSLMGVSVNETEVIAVNKAGGISLKVKTGDRLDFAQTLVGDANYVISNLKVEGLVDGDPHEGGLEYGLTSFTVYMWDEDTVITVYMKENVADVYPLTNLTYEVYNGSVGCAVGAINNPVVTSAKVGDIVYVVPKAIAPFFVEDTSLTVVRNRDEGAFSLGAVNTPDADMVDGKYYPVHDGGKLVGWKYIMPSLGVSMNVEFITKQHDINLSVKDTAGNDLLAEGLVQLFANDVGLLIEVTGKVDDVEYCSVVSAALTPAATMDYTIKSIIVPGEQVNVNNFVMPARDVEMQIVLQPKVLIPETVNFTYSSNSMDMGLLEFYSDSAMTKLIVDKAEVGSTVYVKALCDDGYKVKDISVTNKLDKTQIVETVGADSYKFVMPKDGVNIHVNFEAKEYTLTIDCAAADQNRVQVRVGTGTSHIVKKGDTITVPFNTLLTVSVYDSNFTLENVASTVNGVTTVTPAYGHAVLYMPAADMTIDFTLK